MTPEQRNLLASIAVIALIFLGIYYYRSQKDVGVEAPGEDNEVLEEDSTDTESNVPAGEDESVNNTPSAADVDAIAAANRAKWDTAMQNARIAFGKGEYSKAIAYYNEALTLRKTDSVYGGLFVVYSAQNNTEKAKSAIDSAIQLNPKFTEYWNSKLTFLNRWIIMAK